MKKITKILILALAVIMIFGSVGVFAAEPYTTYTYSIDGKPLESPNAYKTAGSFDSLSMNIGAITPDTPKLNSPGDIVADNNGDIYIADTGNNRVVILDGASYVAKAVIDSYEDRDTGKIETFKTPSGVFVTDPNKMADGSSHIYVCDKENKRVVVFDRNYNHIQTIVKPESTILEEDAFKPCAIAVDIYGRIYITSTACFEGVIVLSSEGDFTGFSGVQKVSYSLIDMIWRNFQTKEQRDSQDRKLAVAYNNVTVDDDGFVYVTANSTTDKNFMDNQFQSIRNPSASNSPVKKLNSAGKEIMSRNGFFDPAGEVDVKSTNVSQLIDVAVGSEGSWTVLDSSRSRVFTYDQSGNLLFAFGGVGNQMGNAQALIGMTYQMIDAQNRFILLDNNTKLSGYRITVYKPTEYHESIMSALRNSNEHNYSSAIGDWEEVLKFNSNFDLAYIGIGKALFNQGKYEEAQKMLESAYETQYHDKAFMEIRKGIIQNWLLLLVVAVVAIVVLVVKFFGFAKKKNKEVTLKVGKKTYGEELLYAFYLIFHPFDAFWDLKHEKRGSVRASLTIMAVTVIAFFYQAIGQGYSFNPRGDYSTVFIQVIAVVIPVALWCVGNWCLTTLFDGEGSFKDIVIATGYALTPLPIFVTISTILTNLMTASEGSMVGLLVTIGYIWVGLLLFFGMLVTHDYTINKNFVTVLGTIVAMAIIIFVIVLFSGLVTKMVTFVISIFTEIGNRV